MRTDTDPWAIGCRAADFALNGNRDRRTAQIRVLHVLGEAPGTPRDLLHWLGVVERVLNDADPSALDAKTKQSINAPCRRHGSPIAALS